MVDVMYEINETDRVVGSRRLAAGDARTVTIGRTFRAPIEDVWDACTNPERIPRWFLPVTGELRLGGRYQLEGNAGGTVETCDPPNGFTATWEFGGEVTWIELRLSRLADEPAGLVPADGGGRPRGTVADEPAGLVPAEGGGRQRGTVADEPAGLVPAGGGGRPRGNEEIGTRFELDHIAHVDDERWLEFGPGAVGIGWDLAVLGLALHLDSGGEIAAEYGLAWLASPEARTFVEHSSEDWYRASVAAGTPADQARAAADRCRQAYTPPEPDGQG